MGHDYVDVVTSPTCTTGGYTTHTCSRCGDFYTDSETNPLGHDLVNHEAQAPTCTAIGWAAYDTCSRCDYTTYEEIAALGHDYDAAVTSPTCTEGGYTTHTCSRCKDSYTDSETDALGHDYKSVVTAPTCTAGGYTTYTCSRCFDTYKADETDPLGHTWEWVVDAEPQELVPGVKHEECSVCHEKRNENTPIDALPCTHANTDVLYGLGQEEEVTDQATLYAFTYCLACEELLGTDSNIITLASATVPYDGTAHSLTVSAEKAFPDGFSVTYSGNGQTAAGEYEVTAHFYFDEEENEIFLTATLTIVKDGTYHEVIFAAEDGNLSFTIPHGESIAEGLIPAIPGVTGYTRAWDYDGGAIEADETFTIIDTPITYTITYVLGDLTNSTKNPDTYTIESKTIFLNSAITPEDSGVAFEGWYTSDSFDPDTRFTAILKGSMGDLVLYANIVSFRVEEAEGFVFDGESFNHPAFARTVSATVENISLSSVIFVTEGCTWTLSYDEEGAYILKTKKLPLNEGVNTAYVTVWYNESDYLIYLLRIYRLGSRNYVFVNWGDTVESDNDVEEGTMISAPETDPAHEGYTFVGWSVGGKIVSFPYALNENTTFTAEFTPNDYLLTYDVAEGDPLEENEVTVTYDATLTPAIPTRTGYIFDGWANKYETVRAPFTWQYAEDMTFVALWTPIDYAITYDFADADSVSKGANNEANPATYTIEDEVTFLAPSRVGYTFTGWDVESIEVGTYGEMTVTASWTVINYDITYDVTVPESSASKVVDNTANPTTYTVEDSVTFNTQIRRGYTAIWDIPSINAGTTGNKIITATWSVIDYRITYVLNGGTNASSNPATFTVEQLPIDLADPSISTNEVFYRWLKNSSFGNDIHYINEIGDITLYAEYSSGTQGLQYELNGSGYLVSGYSGTDRNVVIGKEYNGKPVTGIKSYAFERQSITSVKISNTVTYIGNSAFEDCCYLRYLTIGSGVKEIWNAAFYGCSSLTSVTIPNNVTTLSSCAFDSCSGLNSVTIGSGVKTIESGTFEFCSSLTSIVIPNTVTAIGESAFYSCTALTSITIPSSVTTVGASAFKNCPIKNARIPASLISKIPKSSLISVTITAGSSLDDQAFSGASKLTSVTIPSSVTSIGSSAFSGCSSLQYNEYDNAYYLGNEVNPYVVLITAKNTSITECTINTNTKVVYSSAFRGCSGLTSITIPSGVTSIGDYAFYGCSGLTSVTIPDSVTSIGSSAFYGCSCLTSITIPFVGRSEKTSSSTYQYPFGYIFGTSSYAGSTAVTQYYYGSSTSSTTSTTYYIPSSLRSVTVTGGNILRGAFSGCSGLTSVTIPDGVTSIGKGAFDDCSGLASITIPSSVKTIGQYAFSGCSASILWGDDPSIKVIGSYAFAGYGGLSITIPSSVTSIGSSAFEGCSGLTSITIPSSVTSIGSYAFDDCYKLVEVYNKSTLSISKGNSSYGYVGYYAKNVYTAEGDSKLSTTEDGYLLYTDGDFVSLIAYTGAEKVLRLPSGITEIYLYAFYNCSGLTSITIPDSVTSIGDYAFSQCTGLTSVTLGSGVTSIGVRAFYNCSGLTSITIPDSVTSIGDYAFSQCTGLTSVTLGSGVTSIGVRAFESCSDLTSITIPDSVTSIGSSAFYGCSDLTDIYYTGDLAGWCAISGLFDLMYYGSSSKSLYIGGEKITDVVIPSGVTSIASYAFQHCSGLTSVTIPDSVTSIGSSAFYGCSGLTSIYYMGDVAGWCNISWLYNLMSYGSSSKSLYIGGVKVEGDLVIPDSVTAISSSAFRGCTGLTSITIPDSVTSIGSSAFYGCSGLTSITIPDSVTSIGSSAFYGCSGLTSVTIPDSVTSIGASAFSGCSSLAEITIPFVGAVAGKTSTDTYQYPFGYIFGESSYTGGTAVEQFYYSSSTSSTTSTTYYIPSTLRSVTVTGGNILYGAFYNCSMLTSITIPDSVTSIGQYAFYNCSGLTDIYYTGDLAGWCAISGLFDLMYYGSSSKSLYIGGEKITDLVIPSGVTDIPYSAFYYCTGLTSVTIGNGVKIIRAYAFYGCKSLTSVTIGSGVTSIEERAFQYCYKLVEVYNKSSRSIAAGSSNYGYVGYYAKNVYTAEGDSKLSTTEDGYVLYTDGDLISLVGYIGTASELAIPAGITEIYQYAFAHCTGLISVTIPNSVTSIGSSAFYGCNRLVEIYNKSSLNITKGSNEYGYIGYYAKNVYTEEGGSNFIIDNGYIIYADWDGVILMGYTGTETELTLPFGITGIDQSVFRGRSDLTSITVPNSVTSIGTEAFLDCRGLTSVTIGSGVTEIWENAFKGCYKLVEVYNKSSLNITKGSWDYGYVGSYAKNVYTEESGSKLSTDENGYILYKDGSLVSLIGYTGSETELTLPSGITEIYKYAFYGCSRLTSVTIPSSVTSIGEGAFYNCSGLKSIYYTGDVAGWCGIAGLNNLMSYGSSTKSLYISGAKVKGDLVIPDSVTSIGSYAFGYCSGLTSVTIGSGVTSIEERAFSGCHGLTSVTIGNGVTSIGYSAFYNCSGLTSVTIPDSVNSIGASAFYNCSGLTSVTIGRGVESIWNDAFYGCYKLVEVYDRSFRGITKGSKNYGYIGYYAKNVYKEAGGSKLSTDENGYILYKDGNLVSLIGYTGTKTELTLPSGITEIYQYAFYNCIGLTSIAIPVSVKSIGDYAFSGCSSLTSITYQGTVLQWNAITKGTGWNYNTGNYTIN